MNVEKTIGYILDMQAKAEERAYRTDRRMDRLETSIAQTIRVAKLMVRPAVPCAATCGNCSTGVEKWNSGEPRASAIALKPSRTWLKSPANWTR